MNLTEIRKSAMSAAAGSTLVLGAHRERDRRIDGGTFALGPPIAALYEHHEYKFHPPTGALLHIARRLVRGKALR